jgi:hypothetical protein
VLGFRFGHLVGTQPREVPFAKIWKLGAFEAGVLFVEWGGGLACKVQGCATTLNVVWSGLFVTCKHDRDYTENWWVCTFLNWARIVNFNRSIDNASVFDVATTVSIACAQRPSPILISTLRHCDPL